MADILSFGRYLRLNIPYYFLGFGPWDER